MSLNTSNLTPNAILQQVWMFQISTISVIRK